MKDLYTEQEEKIAEHAEAAAILAWWEEHGEWSSMLQGTPADMRWEIVTTWGARHYGPTFSAAVRKAMEEVTQ